MTLLTLPVGVLSKGLGNCQHFVFCFLFSFLKGKQKPLRGCLLVSICSAGRPYTISTGAAIHSAARPVPFPIVSLRR